MNYAEKFGLGDLESLAFSERAGAVKVDAHLLFSGDFHRFGSDLVISDALHRVVITDYFRGEKHRTLASHEGAPLDPKVVDALTGNTAYAQAGGAIAAKLIGHVAKLTGSASVVRNGVTVELQNGDAVYQTDVVQTGNSSMLGLVLIDGTTFNLSAGARLMLNDLTYDVTSNSNASLFTLVQGAVNFVAGQVAKTGDMKVATPVATMGIRGTAVILDISATDGKVSISVIDQHDGQIHAVQVFNPRGDLIGTVSSNGSALTLTPTTNFDVIAEQSGKTPTQIAQEFAVFQAVLNTYDLQKAIDPSLPQHTDNGSGNSANPQTKTASLGSSSPINATGSDLSHSGTGSGSQTGGSVPEQGTTGGPSLGAAIGSTGQTQNVVNVVLTDSHGDTFDQTAAVSRNGDHALVISGAVAGTAVEGGVIVALNATANATTDSTRPLTVANVPAPLPAGVAYNQDTHTFSLDPTVAAYQHLPAGMTTIVTVNYDISDGQLTASASISWTVTGVNDLASVSGLFSGILVEDGNSASSGSGSESASGTLTIQDVDDGESHFQTIDASALIGAWGNFTFDVNTGHWIYTLDHDKSQPLAKNEVVHDTLVVSSADGTATKVIDVTTTGTNDPATIDGTSKAHLVEDSSTSKAGGTLTVHDLDHNESHFRSVENSTLVGQYGKFTFDPINGEWNYQLDQDEARSLARGEVVHDTLTVTSFDGTANQLIDVSITGVNNKATIDGQSTGAVIEDTATTVSGTLVVHDTDEGENVFRPMTGSALQGLYGLFTFDSSSGQWTYDLDHARANGLSDSQIAHDQLSVQSADGTATQLIDVTVTGKNDAPIVDHSVISGTINVPTSGASSSNTDALGHALSQSGLIHLSSSEDGFGPHMLAANDDGSTGAVDIRSVFRDGLNFYGETNYSSFFINNNGNITFERASEQYTPNRIDGGADNPIIAPFWADVDTRNVNSGLVHYDFDAADGVMTITWDNVGYYNEKSDKLDTFQLVLINEGSGNFDIEYRFGQINWTTGDSSGGVHGIGGTAARVGYSAGDGSHYFELSQSGHTDTLQALPTTVGNTGIKGVFHFEVRNGEVASSTLTTSGMIDYSDPDLNDTHSASAIYTGSGTALGSLTLVKTADTTGSGVGGEFRWTYVADAAQVRSALANEHVHSKIETFDVTIKDDHGGTTTQAISVTLTDGNRPATFGGESAGPLIEDATITNSGETIALDTVSGTLTVQDPDQGEDHFQMINSNALVGTYGTFTFNSDTGEWTYQLDHDKAQPLSDGEVVTDTLAVHSLDGSSTNIVVNITGTNDAPTFDPVSVQSESDGSPVLIASNVQAVDVDFNGGTLVAAITEAGDGDKLSIAQSHYIEIDGTNVKFDADGSGNTAHFVNIGTLSQDSDSSLQIVLNEHASTAAMTALTQAIQFETADNAGAGERDVSVSLNDGFKTAHLSAHVIVNAGSRDNGDSVQTDAVGGNGPSQNSNADSPTGTIFVDDGNDNTFMASPGNDTFVFAANNGHDTISNFAQGHDAIDLSAVGLGEMADFDSWKALHTSASADHLTDTLIDLNGDLNSAYGSDSTILLKGIALANLQASDFVFHR